MTRLMKPHVLLISLALGLTGASAAQAAMTSTQIEEMIIGKRMIANRLGAETSVLYDPSGTVQVNDAAMGGTGTWTLTEGTFCITMMTGPNLGETCMTIEQRAEGVFATSTGMTLSSAR